MQALILILVFINTVYLDDLVGQSEQSKYKQRCFECIKEIK